MKAEGRTLDKSMCQWRTDGGMGVRSTSIERLYNEMTRITKDLLCPSRIPIWHVYCKRLYSEDHYNEFTNTTMEYRRPR